MYRILSTFHAAISPFIDPITKAKIVMLTTEATVHEELLKVVDTSVLESSFGGSDAREFNAEVYFSTTIETDYYSVLPPNVETSDGKIDSSVPAVGTVPAVEPVVPSTEPFVPVVVTVTTSNAAPAAEAVPTTLAPPPLYNGNNSVNSSIDDVGQQKPLSPLPPTPPPPQHNEENQIQPGEGKGNPVSGHEKEASSSETTK